MSVGPGSFSFGKLANFKNFIMKCFVFSLDVLDAGTC